ncbi:MAG: hypothetical protein PVG61_01315 [Dehalococcoidia bacterium]|jgi:hypothetical protein
MAELKYEKYFIKDTGFKPPKDDKRPFSKFEVPKIHHILGISRRRIDGAITMNCSWMLAGEEPGKMDRHTHPYPEIIGFVGTNPDDLHDLGAEADIWMDDEQYILTTSFLVYVPTGLKHCPLTVRNITRPVFHFDLQITTGDFKADFKNM